MSSSAPSPVVGLALYLRLREGDPTAPSDLVAAYVDHLYSFLVQRHRHCDPHLCQEAAHDALLDLIRNPMHFNPARGELGAFLRMAAQRDLFNRLRRESKHHHEMLPDPVELATPAGNDPERAEDDPALAAAIRAFTAEERTVWELMIAGERDTATFACALGRGDWPTAEQRALVYPIKDRIVQRLRRAWRRCHE